MSNSSAKWYAAGLLPAITGLGIDKHQGLDVSESPAESPTFRNNSRVVFFSLLPPAFCFSSWARSLSTDAGQWLNVYPHSVYYESRISASEKYVISGYLRHTHENVYDHNIVKEHFDSEVDRIVSVS